MVGSTALPDPNVVGEADSLLRFERETENVDVIRHVDTFRRTCAQLIAERAGA